MTSAPLSMQWSRDNSLIRKITGLFLTREHFLINSV